MLSSRTHASGGRQPVLLQLQGKQHKQCSVARAECSAGELAWLTASRLLSHAYRNEQGEESSQPSSDLSVA